MWDQVSDIGLIVLFCVAGFLVRLAKKFIVQDISPLDYITLNYKRSLLALGTIIGSAFAIYLANPETPVLQYLLLAYMADSLVNKTPTDSEIYLKHNKV